jgi:predicted transcriptional regulator
MKRIIIIGIIAALFAGCGGGASSIDKSVSQVEKALEKVEKNKGKMTEDDWRSLEKELEEPLKVISDALESDKVGVLAKVKIVTLAARWAAALSEAGISEIEKQTGINRENWGDELEKVAKELEKVSEELEQIKTDSVSN